MKDYLLRMMVPQAFWTAELSKVGGPQKRVVDQYIAGFGKYRVKGWGLILWGDFGTGKTATGVVLLKECVIKNRLTGLWILSEDLPKFAIEKTPFDKEQSMMERIEAVDLLVLDEMIFHRGDKFIDTIVETIFRKRLAALKPTCITTNMSPSQMRDSYPALASVMTEAMYPIKCEGTFRKTLCSEIEREFKS